MQLAGWGFHENASTKVLNIDSRYSSHNSGRTRRLRTVLHGFTGAWLHTLMEKLFRCKLS
jgi:hypothetical protein